MATKWYFRRFWACGDGPTDEQTSWTPDERSSGYATPIFMLSLKSSSGAFNRTIAATADNQYGYYRVFCSPPLLAQSLPSQNLTIALSGYSSTDNTFKLACGVYVWRGGSNVATILSNRTVSSRVDFGDSDGRVETFSSSAVTLQEGDIICCEIWMHDDAGNGNGDNVSFRWAGANDPVDGVMDASPACYIKFATTTIQEIKNSSRRVVCSH